MSINGIKPSVLQTICQNGQYKNFPQLNKALEALVKDPKAAVDVKGEGFLNFRKVTNRCAAFFTAIGMLFTIMAHNIRMGRNQAYNQKITAAAKTLADLIASAQKRAVGPTEPMKVEAGPTEPMKIEEEKPAQTQIDEYIFSGVPAFNQEQLTDIEFDFVQQKKPAEASSKEEYIVGTVPNFSEGEQTDAEFDFVQQQQQQKQAVEEKKQADAVFFTNFKAEFNFEDLFQDSEAVKQQEIEDIIRKATPNFLSQDEITNAEYAFVQEQAVKHQAILDTIAKTAQVAPSQEKQTEAEFASVQKAAEEQEIAEKLFIENEVFSLSDGALTDVSQINVELHALRKLRAINKKQLKQLDGQSNKLLKDLTVVSGKLNEASNSNAKDEVLEQLSKENQEVKTKMEICVSSIEKIKAEDKKQLKEINKLKALVKNYL